MTEKATKGHSLGERHRHGGGHHDPGVLAGGIRLKLRGQSVWYRLSNLSSASLSCPLPAPLAPHAETTKWYLGIRRKLGKPRFYCLGGERTFQIIFYTSSHLILPTVTRRKLTLIVLPAGFLLN